MRKILTTNIIILSLLFVTGCLNYKQITTLKTDGSGRMFVHYWADWKGEQDTIIYNRLGLFNDSLIYKEFDSPYNDIESIETFKNYRDSTIHAQVELSFNRIDSLNYSKAFRGAEFSLKPVAGKNMEFSQFIPSFATGFGIENQDFQLQYVYYIPGNILQHNASEISNNKLTWNYSLDEIGKGKLLKVTYRPFKLKETPLWIYISLIIIIFIVAVFIFIKK